MPASPAVPVQRLDSLGVVVKDLRAMATNYAEVYGIDEWKVDTLDPDRLRLTIDGRQTSPTIRTATGTTPSGAVTFRLLEAVDGESTEMVFRIVRGEGIHDLEIPMADADEGAAVADAVAKAGIPVAASGVIDGTDHFWILDTRARLGGYYLRLVAADGRRAAQEEWNLSGEYERPAGVEPLHVPQLHHLGIVVGDAIERCRCHSQVFDIPVWNFINWRREQGRLEDPKYRGEDTDHEFFCGRAFDFRNFGLEVIQPTKGESDYQAVLDTTGEGVHHLMLLWPESEEQWAQIRDWMTSMGVEVVMESGLRGHSSRYRYLNTREKLGGYVIECVGPRSGLPQVGPTNDFTIDFSAQDQ